MRIGENIKNFRIFRNIKQQELADSLGKSKSVISNWERGENAPDVESCQKLCKIFNVTPNQLFGWESNPEYQAFQQQLVEYQARIELLKSDKERLLRQVKDIEDKIAQETQKLYERENIDDD
jgi:transcriptional regulator with XRE-family HTH domain